MHFNPACNDFPWNKCKIHDLLSHNWVSVKISSTTWLSISGFQSYVYPPWKVLSRLNLNQSQLCRHTDHRGGPIWPPQIELNGIHVLWKDSHAASLSEFVQAVVSPRAPCVLPSMCGSASASGPEGGGAPNSNVSSPRRCSCLRCVNQKIWPGDWRQFL